MKHTIKAAINLFLIFIILTGCSPRVTVTAAMPPAALPSPAQAWSFGVIADTQWTEADDGFNPNTTSANIIKQVDRALIQAGVKLVVALGDTVDAGSPANIGTRALYAQDLYNAGIGFYPLRGNHEATSDANSAQEFRDDFPQTADGVNNATPSTITPALIPAADLANNPPALKTGPTFTLGANFSQPRVVNTANHSLSYAFRYHNVTFMLLDQFVNGDFSNSSIPQQQGWIDATLSSRPANSHAFVFTHKNLLGAAHKDNLFGAAITPADPGDGSGVDTAKLTPDEQTALSAKVSAENAFIASMQANKVYYVISGHDHNFYASIVTSPDGGSKVHQVISQSASSKFYTPALPVSANDAPLAQDQDRIGFYIYTIGGPRVTIDYYADSTGGGYYGKNGGAFHFVKMSSLSCSLNGKEFPVAQNAPYTSVNDNTDIATALEPGFIGTRMSILSGANTSATTTNYGKAMINNVTTAWAAAEPGMSSDTLNLGGMAKAPGSASTDDYVLSMSYMPGSGADALIQSGRFGLRARDAKGSWVLAVTQNDHGSLKFVSGPWNPSDTLGTYGIDIPQHTAWAVLNTQGEYAVGSSFPLFLPLVNRH